MCQQTNSGTHSLRQGLIPPHLNWYQVSQIALSVPWCETLLIMDSCNSAMAGIRPDGEILTAAGWESVTPASLTFSFTQILINEIKAQNGRAFAACDLHSNLMTNAITNNMRATPIHKTNLNHPSVLFHKIGSREARELIRAPQGSTARVLIAVSITRSTLPNVKEWKEWLSSNMPPGIRDIEIVAHWESSSRTSLVCVPVQVWDYLKDHPAYNFVSFVLGDVSIGLPPPPEPAPLAAQAQRASKAKENMPPGSPGGPNVARGSSSSGGPQLPIRPPPRA